LEKQIKTIDEYIRAFPADVQVKLEEVRRTIRKAAPEVLEAISYGMPTFRLNGKHLIHFAAWKNHIGIYPVPSGTELFQSEIAVYRAVRSSARFPLNKPIPFDLIEKMVSFRIKEI
jgi:uncharacterized protein YdhG (YjbR/CyaY superfamily)